MKVASYCRVSTDKEDQANSFAAQQRYFKEYIDRQSDWDLYKIYADEGITGTNTEKRVQFNQMINDAHMRKFNLIITKEVSRFSRNILDTIAYTRQLKALGIGVIFMNDGINTLESDSELRLSIMGSIAQEESRKTSARVKWGQTRQMERGVVFGHSLLGYDVKGGKISINEEGAAIVRSIFYRYGVEKKGTSTIARELREEGYRTYTGNPYWTTSHILKILRNEKYVGDLTQKKSYTPDYLTHKKKTNYGEEPFIKSENHHEPIIDRELWELVEQELAKRNLHGKDWGHSNRYLFSGRIKCAACGSSFVSRTRKLKNGSTKRWMCYKATVEGSKRQDPQGNTIGCDIGRLLRDDVALDMLKQSLQSLQIDFSEVIRNVASLAAEAILEGGNGTGDTPERIKFEITRAQVKKEDVMDAYFSKDITKEEMRTMILRYDKQLSDLQSRLEKEEATQESELKKDSLCETLQEELYSIVNGEKKSELFYKNLLDYVTVHKDHTELRLNYLPHVFEFAG